MTTQGIELSDTTTRQEKLVGVKPELIRGGDRKRKTEPKDYFPVATGIPNNLFLPRRASQQRNAFSPVFDSVSKIHATTGEILDFLRDVHPSIASALHSALRLAFPTEGINIVAVKNENAEGEMPDKEMTLALHNLWAAQPDFLGGLGGCAEKLMLELMLNGLACVECVPGFPFEGVYRIYPVRGQSIHFKQNDKSDDPVPYQFQRFPDKNILANQQQVMLSNYQELNPVLFFWRAVDAGVDDAYGCPVYSAALSEAMADLALIQDLRDAVHNAAWPRLDVGVDMEQLHKVAVEIYRITDPIEAAKWVNARWTETVDYVNGLYPDDNIIHQSTGKVNTLQPGSFIGVENVLSFLRQRMVQSLKTLPTLMGINDGSTFNYTSVEWQIYALGLETIRDLVRDILESVMNLHMRLLGSTSTCKMTYPPIRVTDELIDANTVNVRIQNAKALLLLGFINVEEACHDLTGHGIRGIMQEGALLPVPAGPPGDNTKNPPNGSVNQGTTKETRDAKK